MVKGNVRYRRKARKNGRPKMSSRKKWLIAGVSFAILILAGLILFLFVKPAFLEGIFQNGSEASINTGGTSNVKSTETVNTPQTTSKPSSGSRSPAVVSLSGSNNDMYYSNLANLLSQTPMVQDLPNGESILLRFYNFNSGNREFEKSYILTKGSAKEGFLDYPEITIVVHSKYVPELGNDNLCETIKRADSNNDVGIYTDLSTTKLVMKFSSMMKYKDCIL